LSVETPPTADEWRAFLDRVEKTYEQADLDRYTLERSLMMSSSEMQQVYDDLRRSEQQLRTLTEQSPNLIFVYEGDSTIRYANLTLLRTLGYGDASEVLGKSSLMFVHPEDRAELDAYRRAREERHASELGPLHMRWMCRDGSVRFVESVGTAITFDDKPAMLVIGRDVTDTRRLEEQLRQSQKMEAVGQLAGGIAHDFNNLLSAILGFANLILDDLPPSHPMGEDVQEIRRAGERAAELTRQLVAFSRKQVLQPKTIDLGHVVASMRGMLRRLLGEGITLTLASEADLRSVDADPNQIEQVILNLVVNARDALTSGSGVAQGGEIRIETTNLDIASPSGTPSLSLELKPGRYVALSVEDNGVGMDAETIAHIFEPFFTTKDVGKGTGLGLSTVFGIVKQSGGHISVESEPGRGARFRILFPCAEHNAPLAEAHEAPASVDSCRPPAKDVTILVVEDEDQVRSVATMTLRRQGYAVLEAQNGGEAFLLCETHPAKIDLLLADVVMPRMSGPELASRLTAMRPDMKVLYMSGYPRNALGPGALQDGASLIEKPLTPDSLRRRVRDALSRER
jgi:PAS domain S-box-containing protein